MTNLEPASITVRDAQAADMGDVLRIHTPYVLLGLATFDLHRSIGWSAPEVLEA